MCGGNISHWGDIFSLVMPKERKLNPLDKYVGEQLEAYEQARKEGHPGRQRRLKEVIMTSRIENFLGARIKNIPVEVRNVVKNRLPVTALRVLWYSPCIFLWREEDDPLVGDLMKRSPCEMWKESRYREEVMDYMRVVADNLES